MPQNIQYRIYVNRHSRAWMHVVFWILTFLQMCFFNSGMFGERLFGVHTLILSSMALISILLNHYTISYFILPRLVKEESVRSIMFLAMLYLFAQFVSWSVFYVLNRSHSASAIVEALSHQFNVDKLTDIFGYDQFIWVFSIILSYNLQALAAKIFIDYYEVQQDELRIKSESQAMETAMLRVHINPNFLLRVLNHVHQSIPPGERASEAISRFAELMRFSFFDISQDEITLQEEIGFIKNYVELERMRHRADRVEIVLDVKASNAMDLNIRPLLLINFVENAFKHGVNATTGSAYVHVHIHEQDGVLTFRIVNNKTVRPHVISSVMNKTGGIGLANVKRRLELEYADRHILTTSETEAKFEVDLKLRLKQ